MNTIPTTSLHSCSGSALRLLFNLALCLCFGLALCAALTGCASVDKSGYLGDWVMTSSSDANLDESSLKMADSLGLDMKLTLNEDGTGTLVVLQDEQSVTWEAKSETEGTITVNNAEGTMQLGELELAVDVDGTQMTFKHA